MIQTREARSPCERPLMIFSLAAQVAACTGSTTPPRAAGLLRQGSQPAQILELLDESGRAWTVYEVQARLSLPRSSVTIALWRLRRLELVAKVGKETSITKPRALYAATL